MKLEEYGTMVPEQWSRTVMKNGLENRVGRAASALPMFL